MAIICNFAKKNWIMSIILFVDEQLNLFVLLVILDINIILHLWEFSSPALADGFTLDFERQQVSSSLQNSPQYSGRSC